VLSLEQFSLNTFSLNVAPHSFLKSPPIPLIFQSYSVSNFLQSGIVSHYWRSIVAVLDGVPEIVWVLQTHGQLHCYSTNTTSPNYSHTGTLYAILDKI